MTGNFAVRLARGCLLVILACGGVLASGCGNGGSRPSEGEVREAYERDVRERFTRAAQWMPRAPVGGGAAALSSKQVGEGIARIRASEFKIVDSQTGESNGGVRFYRAKVEATILLPDGRTQANAGWLTFERTERGWDLKSEGLRAF